MRSVLIAGGLGFVGRHLTEYLLARGDIRHIAIVDNLSGTAVEPDDLERFRRRTVVEICDFTRYAPNGVRFDDIYHLASPVGSLGILRHSGTIARQILDLTSHAVDLAIEMNAKLLFISSSEVYSDAPSHAEAEPLALGRPVGARVEYAAGKYAAEVLIRNRALVSRLQYNICRPFNLVGHGQSVELGFVVARFMQAALAGRPLQVFGDGRQQRSFCDIGDFVAGIVRLQESQHESLTLNFGNPDNRITIRELAEMVLSICRSNSAIEHVDPVALFGSVYSEGHEKEPDIRRARELLGWKPETSLGAMLVRIRDSAMQKRKVA